MNPSPHLFVVLGATGDLFGRKLLPAIHAVATGSGAQVHVLGAASSDLGDEGFREAAAAALADTGLTAGAAGRWCSEHLHYAQIERGKDYSVLARRITELERGTGLPGNRVFYLALPPSVFPTAIMALGDAGLSRGPGTTRLVVEKPFGRDGASARDLNALVHSHFDESQVYRIDHYLGKETVQNLLVFRFTNPIFEASWNRDRIDRVEITVAESLDVGTRGGYYDGAGVVRDMLQNHLTQVMTLIAMEAPVSLDADAIRDEKVKVLRAVGPVAEESIRLGQYTGYLDSSDVAAGSRTPTYGAVRLGIDNWRWQGVPFYLRTGKAMAERLTQVAVTFRQPPICLFHGAPDECVSHSDVLFLTLQPDEGFALEIEVKEPGDSGRLRTIPLHFSYGEAFGPLPDAYETLLRDVLEGDQTLFVRADEVDEAWRVFAPTLDAPIEPVRYDRGSWGPASARDLLGDTVPNWATGG